MGTPGQVNHGTIYFDTIEQAHNALDVLQKWIKNVESGQCDESLKGDYGIYKLEHVGNCLYFQAESGRVQNLEWQMENFRDAAKELEGCAEFCADVIIMDPCNSITWSRDEEPITVPKWNSLSSEKQQEKIETTLGTLTEVTNWAEDIQG